MVFQYSPSHFDTLSFGFMNTPDQFELDVESAILGDPKRFFFPPFFPI